MKKFIASAAPILFLLASCGPTLPSDEERLSKLSAECQSQKNSGVKLLEKVSDIKGSGHFLLDQPGPDGAKKVNYKATSALGKTHYLSVDSSTRVFVECLVPGNNYAYVRVVQPDYLSQHRGWVPSSILTANLLDKQLGDSIAPQTNMYVVTSDTRDTYNAQEVKFKETSPATCGSGATPGIRGTGELKVFSPPQTMSVEVVPCSMTDETIVKLSDGRVLYLRKAL